MTFRAGQPVVCVDAHVTNNGGVKELYRGSIYTVSGTSGPCCEAARNHSTLAPDELCIYLAEVDRAAPCLYCGRETPFRASRFRPVQHRAADISALKRLCERPYQCAEGL